ncbi:hypothetical protein Halha_1340 [Halobacteroides halobius DSM 5150]|uniref:Flagellar operon protein TIGR03826 n=1 Tax=Halobacteroides halobius (strain ATCC 35273 / DSM 5150 / MD-1) TaxID=748449 RepID=L0K9U7_HALHC|nr:hypothetical protein [Halobacteroides halobius]AGB41285.1 hypothetical protein Halha_1340 [Halobacteroides halobius DSM 5150]
MSLQKCSKCGTVFINQHTDRELCSDCFTKERDNFRKVRDYLWDHTGATVEEIAQETGVKEKIIRRFIREGRFNRR